MVTSNWFFAFVKARKVGQQFIRGSKQDFRILQGHGTIAKSSFTSLPPTHSRTSGRTNFLFKIEPKRNLSSSNASVANQAQIIWKQLSWIHLYRGFAGPLVHGANSSSVTSSAQTFSKLQEYGRYSRLGLYHGSRSVLHHNVIKKVSMHNNGTICKNIYFTKPFSSSASGSAGYRAQLAWERLSKLCSYRGHVTPSINKITCAMSLALTRFNIIPSILALVGGELAFSKIAYADGEPLTDNLYSRAQDGHIYITSLIIAVLEIFILFIRTLYLAILLSPAIILAPFADTLGSEYRKTWLTLVHRTLEKAGPAFIKWGQWAATRPDLFPSDLCSELTKLHTKAPAHSFAYTKRTIEKAFSRKISDIFEDFEEEPVASGSVAQIHRASLRFRHPGQNTKKILVAVKVRHPGVSESIRRDFVIINTVAKISNFIPTLKWLRLDESVQQFAVFMMSQVDLAREAAHLSRFIYNFRSWKDVSFPKPLYPLVHPTVLVETYEHGECVSHYVDELDGHERLKGALAHIGTHALLKMLLVDNFVHADMHPGNILVRVAKSKRPDKGLFRLKPHVVFLDVGMTAELSSNDRVNLLEFFKAVAIRDGRTAAKSTLKLSKKQNCPNPKAFIEEVEKSFTFWGTDEGDEVHPAECMHQLLEQVRRHRVNVDGNVCTVMVTMLVLEGWQRKLDPDYDVMHTLQNLLFKSDWAETLRYTVEGLMAP